MSETPSWVEEPGGRRPALPRPAARTPWPLAAAAVVTAVLVVVEIGHVVGRDELVVGLRAFLALVIATQLPMAVAAGRRSPAAAFGLLVCQVTTIVAALAGGFGDLRLALAVGAAAIIVLVAASLSSFPTVTLPSIPSEHRD